MPLTAPLLPGKQWVVSAGISKTNYAEIVFLCRFWARERREKPPAEGRFIWIATAHAVILAKNDHAFSEVVNAAAIATADGMPLVWAMRSFGVKQQQRVYGPTLMLDLCKDAASHGHRIFLYGGHPDVLPILESRLKALFPGLTIAGSHSPPFRPLTEQESKDADRMIQDSDADIVFVGIGAPKQEQWMFDHYRNLPGVTLVGVGAAFDFHAGRLPQAPAWMQRNGLEWLFRLSCEPTRLWRRYILITPRFLPLWLLQKLKSGRESVS